MTDSEQKSQDRRDDQLDFIASILLEIRDALWGIKPSQAEIDKHERIDEDWSRSIEATNAALRTSRAAHATRSDKTTKG